MIFKGSRYEQLAKQAVTVTAADGRAHAALPLRFVPPTPAGFRHTVAAGDRLDLLAFHYYRDPQRFWLIVDANPGMDPDELLVEGRQILIPPDNGAVR